jgi:serine protease AprX
VFESAHPRWLNAATGARRICCALAGAGLFFLPAPEASAQGRSVRLSRDLVERIQSGTGDDTCVIVAGTPAHVDALAAQYGLRVRKRLATGAVVEAPAAALGALAADGSVGALSSNYSLHAHMAVTTTAIGADQVWRDGWAGGARGVTGDGIGVAVIDSGVADVPELRGRIVASVDFTGTGGSGQATGAGCGRVGAAVRGSARDEHGHGTHVAGIIAASGANPRDPTRGVAPGAHIVNLKVLGADGSGNAGDVVEAIDWAVANRARYRIRVINLSLGGPVVQRCADDPVCQAVERAYRSGIVVVASAGNHGKDALGHQVWRLAVRHDRRRAEYEGDGATI